MTTFEAAVEFNFVAIVIEAITVINIPATNKKIQFFIRKNEDVCVWYDMYTVQINRCIG